MRRIPAVTFLILMLAGSASAQHRSEPARLAEQLGARDYRDREAAGRSLDELGAEALPALRTIAKSGDFEASERATALIAKIAKRIANAKAIAGTMVELKAEEQTLGAALESLRKQTGFAIRLDGDQAPLAVKVTPKFGKRTFWDTIDALADATGLVVDVDALAPCANDPKPTNAPFSSRIKRQETSIELLAPAPSVMLRSRSGKAVLPVCVSGAYRIEAIPIPADDLSGISDESIPVRLRVTPEPGVRWMETFDPIIARATDRNLRSLPRYFGPNNRRSAFGEFGQLGQIAREVRRGGTATFENSRYLAQSDLRGDPRVSSTILKDFVGRFRGRQIGPAEMILTVSKLSDAFAAASDGRRTSLRAKCEPIPYEPTARLLTFILDCDPGEYDGSENFGFALFDGDGKPFKLSPYKRPLIDSRTCTEGSEDYASLRMIYEYILRPTDRGDSAKPATLTFSGSRIKTVEIPFAFRDLPVSRGGRKGIDLGSAPLVERIHAGIR